MRMGLRSRSECKSTFFSYGFDFLFRFLFVFFVCVRSQHGRVPQVALEVLLVGSV